MRYVNKLMGLTLGLIMASAPVMAQSADMGSEPLLPPEMHAPKGDMKMHKPDKAEMEKRMAEKREAFVSRLGLTEEQRAKSAQLHEKSRAEMTKIMDEIKVLKEKADALREESKKEFEALLTDEQKEILKQMHQEKEAKHKARAEKHSKAGGKKHRPHHEGRGGKSAE